MKRLTEYYDGEARVLGIGHKKAFAKLAAYEDTELTPEEVAQLKLELISARSRLVDVEKILERVYEFFDSEWDCPIEFDDEVAINICLKDDCELLVDDEVTRCWEKYWALKARKGDETSQIQNRK
jgi:hypothetical protein